MSIRSLAYSLCGPALLAGLLIMSLLSGCTHSPDPLLALADAKMEEHPDSALMILEDYRLSPESTSADSAYHALLLTHARYKNFIDETDDSLISVAADYFLAHNDDAKASRALFLKGMIQMNANRLGDAAVSLRKGLDIAHDGKCYMWEGQCARGLCMLYGQIYDGSAQVEYAKQALDAFYKIDDTEWLLASKLMLARAYNNNCQYHESLETLNDTEFNNAAVTNKTLIAEIHQLKGTSLFALGQYKDCLRKFQKTYQTDPAVLTDNDMKILEIAFNEISGNLPNELKQWYKEFRNTEGESPKMFTMLAELGNYEEAYHSLEQYKNVQDSILSSIFINNVYASINQYETNQNTLRQERLKNERMSYWVLLLVIVIIGLVGFWRFREHIHNEESLRLKMEADIATLRSDLLSHVERAETSQENDLPPSANTMTENFEKIIRQRYAEANRLCDDYYHGYYRKKDKEAIDARIQNIIDSLSERTALDEIAKFVDEKSGNLYSSFKKEFFNLNEESYRIFLYLILGFSPRTISLLIGQNIQAAYTKKSRLKARIEKSDAENKTDFLKVFN